jgi:hypothetical protein
MGSVIWMFVSDSHSGARQVAMTVIAFFSALTGLKKVSADLK